MAKSKVKMLRHIPSGNVHILGKTENWGSMVDRATQYNNGHHIFLNGFRNGINGLIAYFGV